MRRRGPAGATSLEVHAVKSTGEWARTLIEFEVESEVVGARGKSRTRTALPGPRILDPFSMDANYSYIRLL